MLIILASDNSTFFDDILSLFQESNEKEDYDSSVDENITNINTPKIFNYHINKENTKINNNNCYFENDKSCIINCNNCNCKYLNENNCIKNSKKFSEISPIKIILGEEKRTTILIKNIPNLYKQKELIYLFLFTL